MTCEVCQHCHESVSRAEGYAVRGGYSYHTKCHKCYVCSETNLHNAEVFKGVIFCSSCSERIFQGCSTARKNKSGNKSKHKRARSKSKSRKRTFSPVRDTNRARGPIPAGIIELAQLAASESFTSREEEIVDSSKKLEMTTELALQVGKRIYEDSAAENWNNIKKDSIEIGTTTNVTQDLLRMMECPIVENRKNKHKSSTPSHGTRRQIKNDKPIPNLQNTKCSDWRIADKITELGASTEIANMVLRKKSEMPVIIRSLSQLEKKILPRQRSCLNQESDVSGDSNEDWIHGSSSEKDSEKGIMPLKNIHVGSILKIPIKCFKRNILHRSSLIGVMINNESDKNMIFQKVKKFFRDEIVGHQRRGIKRLYSTINRRRTPYRMGWPNLMSNASRSLRMNYSDGKETCKHFQRSHSYRCMRAQVMKIAGPTKSELAIFRFRLKNMVIPNCLKNTLFSTKYADLISRACGSEAVR